MRKHDYVLNEITRMVHDRLRVTERCNVDDIEHRDTLTIDELIDLQCLHGNIQYCEHCWPEDD